VPPPAPTPAANDGPTALWIGGWVAIGLGVAGLGTAAGAGIALLIKKDAIEANCVDNRCNRAGLDAAEDVGTLDTVGTAAFVVGAASTLLGVTLLVVDGTVDITGDGRAAMVSYRLAW
jgi:hypothetical protein